MPSPASISRAAIISTATLPVVLLEKELEGVRTYVAIEKARFRERLNFQLVYDDIPVISLLRLVLQLLV